ncbi:hypothetical protein C5167_011877 [Papaver somniferum]|uniref:Uncharacterized protein n=1 Tax=Papaver somniferum TaxID=3469 RepID=A0A4Y7IVW4_PAPSO|nr:hypothetical protein C5167_011877 [Papaver somniferum]
MELKPILNCARIVSVFRETDHASEYKEQLFWREPLGRRVILINAKVEGSWSNEEKKGLNDEAEVTSHTSELILEQPQE